MLGAAGILLREEGRTVFYTGDVNFDDQTLTKGAVFPESDIDVLIIETTRGDSPLPDGFTRAAEEQGFAEAISRAFARGGCVLVPVFALGKTQEVLAMLYKFKRAKLLEDVPIYIGGLSSKMTAGPSAFAVVPGGRAFRAQRENDRRLTGAPRPHLCALQRNDDAENALQHLRAPGDRSP